MATHKSAAKRARSIARRTVVNRARRSRAHSALSKVESAIAAKDYKAATEAMKDAQRELARSASKGAMPKKRMSRTLSRLSARVKAIKSK
jgi:small subunit ribosomal protein S20